jgi:hypothetical protein
MKSRARQQAASTPSDGSNVCALVERAERGFSIPPSGSCSLTTQSERRFTFCGSSKTLQQQPTYGQPFDVFAKGSETGDCSAHWTISATGSSVRPEFGEVAC